MTDMPSAFFRLRTAALLAAVLGIAACMAGALLDWPRFLQSYLVAFVFAVGLSAGSLGLLLLNHVTGGEWGVSIRRILEASAMAMPLLGLLSLPLLLGLPHVYEWARPANVVGNKLLQHKLAYLNAPFFMLRLALYFALWSVLAWQLGLWSRQQDATDSPAPSHKMQTLAPPGLIVLVLTVTFFAIDVLMSLEPDWYSTMFGLLLLSGQAVSAMSIAILLKTLLTDAEPARVHPSPIHDLGTLLFAFVMLWGYLAFSQYLIIWSGNIAEEATWYVKRLQNGWRFFPPLLVALHFIVPFALLLSRDVKRRPRVLSIIAMLLLLMRLVDIYWIVLPAFHNDVMLHWLDAAAPLALLGIYLSTLLFILKQAPLQPRLPEAPPHPAADGQPLPEGAR